MEANGALYDREEGGGFPHPEGIHSPPLQRPTIRVQDGDIILEDAAPVEQHGGHLDTPNGYELSLEAPGLGETKSFGENATPVHANLNVVRSMQTSALTKNIVTPHPDSRPPLVLNAGDSAAQRKIYHQGPKMEPIEKLAFEKNAIARNENFKLTISNVQQYTDLTQDDGRSSTAERVRVWLQDAGPPYEVQPSVGVPTRGSHNFVSGFTNRDGPPKRGGHLSWLGCFRCIS